MKMTLIGYGTRGDVQPNVCLGWVLQQRGHEITVAAPLNMASFVRAAGLRYCPLPLDVHALFAAEEAQKMLANGKIQAFFAWLGEVEREHAAAMRAALHEACASAEAIVVHPLMEDRAAAFGAARHAPVVPLYFFPVPPSRRFASPFITTYNLGFLNRLTHKLLLDMLWKSSRDDVATLRRELGVAPAATSYVREAQRRGLLTLLAYSEALFPRPDDWGPHDVICGSIVMPEALKQQVGEHALPADLVAWLDQGPAPVFLGFGSMPVLDVEAMLATARAALAAVGARGIVGAGWSRFVGANNPTLRVVGAVDHAALFARCRAAVHHGGSGTTTRASAPVYPRWSVPFSPTNRSGACAAAASGSETPSPSPASTRPGSPPASAKFWTPKCTTAPARSVTFSVASMPSTRWWSCSNDTSRPLRPRAERG